MVHGIALTALLGLLCLSTDAFTEIPRGNEILTESASPNGWWAVTVPTVQELQANEAARNLVIDLKSNKVAATIEGCAGRPRTGHMDTAFIWSGDSKNLFWIVDGKWGPLAVTHLTFETEKPVRQVNVLKLGQKEILKRLKEARPVDYKAAVNENEGNSEAYPDGFTIDVQMLRNKATPPLRFLFGLTSNPKRINGATEIEAVLRGLLTEEGRVTWSDFRSYGKAEILEVRNSMSTITAKLQAQVRRIEESLAGDAKKEFRAEQETWKRALDERFEPPEGDLFSFIGHQAEKARVEALAARLNALSRR